MYTLTQAIFIATKIGRYTNSNTLGRRGRRNYTYYDDSDDYDGESSE